MVKIRKFAWIYWFKPLLYGGYLALAIALDAGGFARQWHVPNALDFRRATLLKNAKGRLFSSFKFV
jgi:hypothetical protein